VIDERVQAIPDTAVVSTRKAVFDQLDTSRNAETGIAVSGNDRVDGERQGKRVADSRRQQATHPSPS
jgi:hypothetical protein